MKGVYSALDCQQQASPYFDTAAGAALAAFRQLVKTCGYSEFNGSRLEATYCNILQKFGMLKSLETVQHFSTSMRLISIHEGFKVCQHP